MVPRGSVVTTVVFLVAVAVSLPTPAQEDGPGQVPTWAQEGGSGQAPAPTQGQTPATAAQAATPAEKPPYVVVLKDGRRLPAREKPVVEENVVKFVAGDGQAQSLPLAEVDLVATERANRPKRLVWTNEEIQTLRTRKQISVVGAQPAEAAKPAAEGAAGGEASAEEGEAEEGEEGAPAAEKPKPRPPREQDPEYYRERLRSLRDDLNRLNRQITDLQRNMQAGAGRQGAGGFSAAQASGGADPRDTLQRLQRQRDELNRQIAAVEDEARRNGISPGAIR